MFNANLLLADYAVVTEGKLTVVGAGWTFTGPDPVPFALAVLIEVPWDQTNRQLHITLNLNDADGAPVFVGGTPVEVHSDVEVGRPPGYPAGTPIMVPLAVNFGSVPLDPGGRYVWELTIDGETRDNWRVGFNTRPAAESE